MKAPVRGSYRYRAGPRPPPSSTTSNSTSAPAFRSSVSSAAASSAKSRSASWRARFRMRRGFGAPAECPAGLLLRRDGFGGRHGAVIHAEVLAPIAAHVLDQRQERLALLRQRVLHARRHLGEGVTLDDPLL